MSKDLDVSFICSLSVVAWQACEKTTARNSTVFFSLYDYEMATSMKWVTRVSRMIADLSRANERTDWPNANFFRAFRRVPLLPIAEKGSNRKSHMSWQRFTSRMSGS